MNKKKNPYAHYQFKNINTDLSNLAAENPLDNLQPEMGGGNDFKQEIVFNKEALANAPFADDPNLYSEPLDTSLLGQQESFEQEEAQDVNLLQSEMAKIEEERLRMLAEMDNFKKRMAREKEEQIRFASEAVLADLIPSLDNFELALSYGHNNVAAGELLQGLQMTHKLLLDALAVHGLEQVGKVDEQFNPEIHEAMTQEKRDDMSPGHVSQLFQPGYRLRGRLLRPAKVVVSC